MHSSYESPSPSAVSLTLTLESSALALDRVEHVAVRLRDRARLVLARDLLAEHVDRRQLPVGVQRRGRRRRLVERRARRCSARRRAARPASARPGSRRTMARSSSVTGGAILCARRGSRLAHEALARGADERHRLGEQHAHRVAQRDRLLVDAARRLHLRERGRGELDGGVRASASRTARAAPPARSRPAAPRTRAAPA